MENLSEAGHWYDKDGLPTYTIVGANGKERNTTLRDARQWGYVPSVTTIIGVAAKPSLENWKVNQALNSAITLEQDPGESIEDFTNRCKQDSKKIGRDAAERGTIIHAMIEQGFMGGKETKAYRVIKDYLDENFPGEEWIAEDSFCSTSGYGGKIDLYSKSGIFVDFKTKDGLKDKQASKLVYDDHGMQLSAYAEGCNFKEPERVSIFVDREDPELIAVHRWDKETHVRHMSMFNSLLSYWKLVKKYDPSEILKNKKDEAA
jgi:hypothetical protein